MTPACDKKVDHVLGQQRAIGDVVRLGLNFLAGIGASDGCGIRMNIEIPAPRRDCVVESLVADNVLFGENVLPINTAGFADADVWAAGDEVCFLESGDALLESLEQHPAVFTSLNLGTCQLCGAGSIAGYADDVEIQF